MKRFLTLCLVTLAAANASAQTAPLRDPSLFAETISVTGSGRSIVTPDRFSFTVGVQTVANTVEDAVNQNNQKVSAVLAALKAAGAQEKDIRTANFSIWPQQDYQQGSLPRILGYQVSNSVTVRSDKIAQIGKLLQVAVNAGVNTSSGIQFEVSDPARGREEALRAAFADARTKAQQLAQAAGRTLGRAMSISEGVQSVPPPQPFPRAMAMKAEASVSEVPIESGTQETTYTVSAVFELR
jgi:uncharacterized protein YggE